MNFRFERIRIEFLLRMIGFILLGCTAVMAERVSSYPVLRINRVSNPPRIDGRIDEACWKEGVEITPFVLYDRKGVASQQTRAHLCYDDHSLYVAVECFDLNLNPVLNKLNEIRANARDRDSLQIFSDDCVELYLQPSLDAAKGYYHLAVNSRGTFYDAYCTSAQDQRPVWNGEVKVATSVNDKSWMVEMAIPLKGLGVERAVLGDKWRVNLCREQQAFHEFSCWSPTLTSFHTPERFGEIIFGENVPRITLASIENKLDEGECRILLEAGSSTKEELTLKTGLRYENGKADVASRSYPVEGGKSTTLTADYLVSEKAAAQSEWLYLSYEIGGKDKTVFYVSSEFPFEKRAKSPIRTRLMTCTFGENFNFIRELYIPRGGAQYLEVAIQSGLRSKYEMCQLVLDLPESMTLMDPTAPERRIPKPIKVVEEKIKRDGVNYRRYLLTCRRDDTFDLGKLPPVTYMGLVLVSASENGPAVSTVYFHTEALVEKKLVREAENQVPLYLLPPLKGRQPSQKIPILDWSTPNSSILVRLGNAEKMRLFQTLKQAGFNYKGLNEFGNDSYSPGDVALFEQLGLAPVKGLRLNTASPHQWTNLAFEDAVKFLAEYPQYRAVSAEGKTLPDVICTSHLLDSRGAYRGAWEKWLGEAAKTYSVLFWDNEIVPTNPNSTCFCDTCLKAFKEYKHISKSITRPQILSDYKNEWIDFQCHRNSEIVHAIRDIIRKANPACLLWVYSGYQCATSRNYYGMDWASMAPYIDRALCGFGRPVEEISETKKSLGSVPCIFGELIWSFEGRSYPMQEVRIHLFRRLIEGGGNGVFVYNDFSVDGRYYEAISDIAALVSDYEDFFTSFKRNDALANVAGGDFAVLQNSRDERLIFVFNDTDKEKEISVSEKELPAAMKAVDAIRGNVFSEAGSQRVKVQANDVCVIAVIKKGRTQIQP